MRHFLLRTLMTICSLGEEWTDPSKIPVEEIVEEWQAQSSKGRYESAMWKAAGLQEPCRRTDKSSGTANDRDDAEGEVEILLPVASSAGGVTDSARARVLWMLDDCPRLTRRPGTFQAPTSNMHAPGKLPPGRGHVNTNRQGME
jgi:hypothetical protein